MKKRTAAGESLTGIILEVFRLNGAMLDAGNQITKPYELTSARWQVMGAIELENQPLTVSQIARRMGLARQGVQRIVGDLQDLDMLTLEMNLDHKRAQLASITPKGSKALKEIDKAQCDWVNQLSNGLSENQLKQTLKLLRSIRDRSELYTKPN